MAEVKITVSVDLTLSQLRSLQRAAALVREVDRLYTDQVPIDANDLDRLWNKYAYAAGIDFVDAIASQANSDIRTMADLMQKDV